MCRNQVTWEIANIFRDISNWAYRSVNIYEYLQYARPGDQESHGEQDSISALNKLTSCAESDNKHIIKEIAKMTSDPKQRCKEDKIAYAMPF